ncbi:MAG: hypothetical protein PGN30_07620 [Mycolicibacterium neoaurum]|uniref:hypothetical protein n=1 Tax=Mycolicibacterium neoaurum TaxID=1795 RepID=UPI002FF7798F
MAAPPRGWYLGLVKQAEGWSSFFTVLASVSAAVMALLFVALQTQADRWRAAPLRRLGAVRNLIELSSPLVVSLTALLPGGSWRVGGTIVGVVGCATVPYYVHIFRREWNRGRDMIGMYEWIQVSLGTALLSGVFGSVLIYSLIGTHEAMVLVSSASIWSLASGVMQTWYLLASDNPVPTCKRSSI